MPDQDATHALTKLLASIQSGEIGCRERLWELVYHELHGMACAQIAREPPGRTLQPTALVHEAFLRLFGSGPSDFQNRRHFFAAAAHAMHRIRVDDARRRKRLKRGCDHRRVEADGDPTVFDQDPLEVLAVDEAMGQLQREQPQLAEVVRLRYFAGLTVDEAAFALDVTPRTVANRWRIAKAMLARAMTAN